MSPSERQSEVIGVATERRGTGQITQGIRGAEGSTHMQAPRPQLEGERLAASRFPQGIGTVP